MTRPRSLAKMPRYHFIRADGKTVCGRALTPTTLTTRNPHLITCQACVNSPYLDADLGNNYNPGTGVTR